jgi:type II secretory pathway pseudopilin PulG
MEYFGHKLKQGITTVEVVFAVAIMGLVVVFTTSTLGLFFSTSHEIINKTQAMYLAEEGMELLRYKRDQDWINIDALSLGTQHYLRVDGFNLQIVSTPEIIDEKFTRSFILDEVSRDVNGDIDSSGTVDDNSKLVEFTVSWATGSITLTSILTNLNGI